MILTLIGFACLFLLLTASLTASNVYVNTSSAAFTPTGGSSIPIGRVAGFSLDYNAAKVSAAADGDLYHTMGGVYDIEPVVALSIVGNTFQTGITQVPGTFGVLVITVNDSRNGATTAGGAKICTISNAYYMPGTIQQNHAELGTVTITFPTLSSDGVTSPVSIAAA